MALTFAEYFPCFTKIVIFVKKRTQKIVIFAKIFKPKRATNKQGIHQCVTNVVALFTRVASAMF